MPPVLEVNKDIVMNHVNETIDQIEIKIVNMILQEDLMLREWLK